VAALSLPLAVRLDRNIHRAIYKRFAAWLNNSATRGGRRFRRDVAWRRGGLCRLAASISR